MGTSDGKNTSAGLEKRQQAKDSGPGPVEAMRIVSEEVVL